MNFSEMVFDRIELRPPVGKVIPYLGMPLFYRGTLRQQFELYIVTSIETSYRPEAMRVDTLNSTCTPAGEVSLGTYFRDGDICFALPGTGLADFRTLWTQWFKALETILRENDMTPIGGISMGSWVCRKGDEHFTKCEPFDYNALPVLSCLEDLVFGNNVERNNLSSLTLKQQNTDGRMVCANPNCGGPIKLLPGFGNQFNHCPVCEP